MIAWEGNLKLRTFHKNRKSLSGKLIGKDKFYIRFGALAFAKYAPA